MQRVPLQKAPLYPITVVQAERKSCLRLQQVNAREIMKEDEKDIQVLGTAALRAAPRARRYGTNAQLGYSYIVSAGAVIKRCISLINYFLYAVFP